MVATRRGVTVCSPTKTTPDQSSDVPATPSRRTRRAVAQNLSESPPRSAPQETSSQLEKNKEPLASSPPASLLKRCTRAARLHSPDQPCSATGSVRDGEMSDVDSVCSVMSNAEPPVTRTRGRRRPLHLVSPEDDEISEVESCSSAVSETSVRRSTRRKAIPKTPGPALAEAGDAHVASASKSRRVTRCLRKTACDRSPAIRHTDDAALSDADSCVSSVSGAETSKSTARRATRSRRQTGSIPAYLDETSDASRSPTSRARLSRAAKAKAADATESQSCDSEGFESGPRYSRTTRSQRKTDSALSDKVDSDSEPTEIQATRSTGTPPRSRRSARAARHSLMDLSIILDKAEVSSINDSTLESTVVQEDADCTLVEADQTFKEGVICTDVTPKAEDTTSAEGGVIVLSEDESPNSSEEMMMMMMDTIQPSKPEKPLQSATETLCESASEVSQTTEEKDESMEAAAVDVAVETGPGQEENAAESNTVRVESSQLRSIMVDSDAERRPEDVVVKSAKIISLLDSSEDEVSEDEEVVEEEEEERAGASHKCEAAAAAAAASAAESSSGGLFMIDTRPGQEADEQYYKEKPMEVDLEGQDEEFVDEEGEDDDDEDAGFLFASRNPLLKEMSSRIDPGIRLKELGGLYINFDGSQSNPVSNSLRKPKGMTVQDEVMKKSVMGPDFEKKDAVPPYSESKKAMKLKNRIERAKSTGDAWFNMKAPEMTQELTRDLQVLKMRGSLDPKRFYKKNDREGFPKYFQIGTVVDSPVDFYHSRVPKKQRKRTMVEELLSDAHFRQSNKKKYQQIVTERAAHGAGKKKGNKFRKK